MGKYYIYPMIPIELTTIEIRRKEIKTKYSSLFFFPSPPKL
jgi:hypothetical protein